MIYEWLKRHIETMRYQRRSTRRRYLLRTIRNLKRDDNSGLMKHILRELPRVYGWRFEEGPYDRVILNMDDGYEVYASAYFFDKACRTALARYCQRLRERKLA